jgi:signal transduction histidine kinase/HAMP domain-containing protein
VRHAGGDAIRIGFASQLSFRTYEMAWLAERISEREDQNVEETERKALKEQLRGQIRVFDGTIDDFRRGNSEAGVWMLKHEEAIAFLNRIADEWGKELRPSFLALIDLPAEVSEQEARALLRSLEIRLPAFADDVDRLATSLNNHYREELEKQKEIRLIILGFFFLAAVAVDVYVKSTIANPLRALRREADEIEKGNYNVRVRVSRKDEVGELSQAFNNMAERIAYAFDELWRRSEDLMALSRASNAIAMVNRASELYQSICDNAMHVFGPRMVWVGVLEERSHELRIAAHAGFDEGYVAMLPVTWSDSPAGCDPSGTAVKTGTPQIVNDLAQDHSRISWLDEAEKRGYKSVLAMPIIYANCVVIGVITLYGDKKDFFTPRITELCQIYTNQTAAVMQNVLLLEDLDARVKERTQALEDARLLAESANMAKSAFLARMSHDLRTPLNAIIGFSEALMQGIYGDVRPDHEEYLKYIYQGGMKLLKLIDEMLDLSRIETGSMDMHYSESNLNDLINGVVHLFDEKMKKHGIRCSSEVEEEAKVAFIDDAKMKQVLVSLLGDSIEATADGGSIHIALRKARGVLLRAEGLAEPVPRGAGARETAPGTAYVEISVEDTRPALTDEERRKFFDPYRQFDTTIVGKQSNMSLHLCRRFVELHGGRIRAEALAAPAADGGGSRAGNRFILLLPQRP